MNIRLKLLLTARAHAVRVSNVKPSRIVKCRRDGTVDEGRTRCTLDHKTVRHVNAQALKLKNPGGGIEHREQCCDADRNKVRLHGWGTALMHAGHGPASGEGVKRRFGIARRDQTRAPGTIPPSFNGSTNAHEKRAMTRAGGHSSSEPIDPSPREFPFPAHAEDVVTRDATQSRGERSSLE